MSFTESVGMHACRNHFSSEAIYDSVAFALGNTIPCMLAYLDDVIASGYVFDSPMYKLHAFVFCIV